MKRDLEVNRLAKAMYLAYMRKATAIRPIGPWSCLPASTHGWWRMLARLALRSVDPARMAVLRHVREQARREIAKERRFNPKGKYLAGWRRSERTIFLTGAECETIAGEKAHG